MIYKILHSVLCENKANRTLTDERKPACAESAADGSVSVRECQASIAWVTRAVCDELALKCDQTLAALAQKARLRRRTSMTVRATWGASEMKRVRAFAGRARMYRQNADTCARLRKVGRSADAPPPSRRAARARLRRRRGCPCRHRAEAAADHATAASRCAAHPRNGAMRRRPPRSHRRTAARRSVRRDCRAQRPARCPPRPSVRVAAPRALRTIGDDHGDIRQTFPARREHRR